MLDFGIAPEGDADDAAVDHDARAIDLTQNASTQKLGTEATRSGDAPIDLT